MNPRHAKPRRTWTRNERIAIALAVAALVIEILNMRHPEINGWDVAALMLAITAGWKVTK